VPTEVVLDRIAGRRVCESCGRTYHVNMPPVSDWTCDTCGGHVVQRADDTAEAVARRLELYEEETVPIVDYYKGLGKLVVVDGVVCTSPNDVGVHGIPSDSVVSAEGDIASFDCGAIIEGWHADAAITIGVGEIDPTSKRLLDTTRRSLEAAIDQVEEGNRLG